MAARDDDSKVGGLRLLLFRVGGGRPFGINVLKVKEVLPEPPLTRAPQTHPAVAGWATLRGEPAAVLDVAFVLGRERAAARGEGVLLVTEFNRSRQGMLVDKVERIITLDWQEVYPPPRSAGAQAYVSGICRVDDGLVQVLDVERVLAEVQGPISMDLDLDAPPADLADELVLVVDDSLTAMHQTTRTLDQLGVRHVSARDGREALELLDRLDADGSRVSMVISDIEMPEMDGYSLTRAIRGRSDREKLYVLLHTSLDGAVSTNEARNAGSDAILLKFTPEGLAEEVMKGLRRPAA